MLVRPYFFFSSFFSFHSKKWLLWVVHNSMRSVLFNTTPFLFLSTHHHSFLFSSPAPPRIRFRSQPGVCGLSLIRYVLKHYMHFWVGHWYNNCI